ncbi:MAG: hypothetical protein ACOYKA_05940 [Legionellaceae bacterium]
MTSFKRDISVTLVLKFLLLFIVWWVGFGHFKKPIINSKQWILQSTHEVDHDYRH